MSVREVQTAAARVVHVDRLNDAALQELRSRFSYHPLDLEALLSAAVEPTCTTYADYAFMTLLWPEATTGDIRTVRFFVDRQTLTIIGDTSTQIIKHTIDTIHASLGSKESQLPPVGVVHELLTRLRAEWNTDAIAMTTTLQTRFRGNAQVIRQFGRWCQTQQLSEFVPQIIIDAHACDGLAERRVVAPLATETKNTDATLPSLMRTYAVASAVMVVVVLVTLSVQ